MRVTYASLHELVDRLSPEQAAALWTVARNMAPAEPTTTATPQPTRTIAFAGTLPNRPAKEEFGPRGDLTTRVAAVDRDQSGS
jgi:hypothetical protein